MKNWIAIAALAASLPATAGWGGAAAAAHGQYGTGQGRPTSSNDGYQPRGIAASFTGNMQQVQTVSGEYAWRCEYTVNGQTFTRVYRDSCPGIIQVQ